MTFETRFHRDLEAALSKTKTEKAEQLARGCADDFADYRYRTGVIKGLEEAAQHAADVARAIFGGDEQENR